jgi:hypothetical protein
MLVQINDNKDKHIHYNLPLIIVMSTSSKKKNNNKNTICIKEQTHVLIYGTKYISLYLNNLKFLFP